MGPFVALVLLVAGVVTFTVSAARIMRRGRSQDVAQWAEANGWEYVGTDPVLAQRWTGRPFGIGIDRVARDVVRGNVDGFDMVSFTYTWRSGAPEGDSRRLGLRRTAHVVALDALPGEPVVDLSPEGLREKWQKLFGAQDVQIDNPAFDGQWLVRTSDEFFARRALDARLANIVMLPDFHGSRLRIEGPSVLLWRPGRTDVTTLHERAKRVADVARIVLPMEKGGPRFESGGTIDGFGIPGLT
ncbi:hypothetical protein ACFQHV_22550 [Promicromonospora thailandica]|uniref:DUF3137 domain-containing protein n=1 Tax=Promicromonospora thailandica TaxID=765201 RepID=A0A9X2G7M4_9MICO|nr:hypothetical protein [Promicromonospora thailandica]MCP2263406.1 hypothetical protein [Promicromonospora thailandica]